MVVVASALGKVLVTGSYIVLERPNAGLVLSTNTRFYAIVKPIYAETRPNAWAWAWTDVRLTSPQLSRDALYKLALKNLTIQTVSSSETRNPFVEYAVQYSVAAAYATFDQNKKDLLHKLLLQCLDITILGSNDFYSYRNEIERRGLPLTSESLATLPPFASISFNTGDANDGNSKPEVAKTGLFELEENYRLNKSFLSFKFYNELKRIRIFGGFFQMMENSIQENILEEDEEQRENGELFEIKLALKLGRSLSQLRDLGSSSNMPMVPYQSACLSDLEKLHMSDLAASAMGELVRLLQTDDPLWMKSNTDGKDVLTLDAYAMMFDKTGNRLKNPNIRIEASRDSGVVIMNSLTLVEMFMDPNKWMELFPTIMTMAKTIENIVLGMMGGYSGSLQLMYEDLQVLSPFVPIREFYFLSHCQQIIIDGPHFQL